MNTIQAISRCMKMPISRCMKMPISRCMKMPQREWRVAAAGAKHLCSPCLVTVNALVERTPALPVRTVGHGQAMDS